MNKPVFVAIFAALVLSMSAGFAQSPDELTVFTAASLTGAFGEIGEMYENETGIHVAFNFDGSQALRTQLENGAYADLFASANMKQMNAVRESGLVNNSSVAIFTRNKLSLIVPKDNPANIRNLTDLARPGVKIVMGTKDVPVGDYALQIIAKLGNDSAYGPDYETEVMANVISQETSVSYVVTKVALGEADAGFAYVSDVTQDMISKIDKIVIPDEYNIIAEYPLGMLMESKYPAESQRFMDLVMSDEGRAVLEKYGFDPVESEPEVREETASATEAAA
ncbi:MAG: molybdate ABC transporter substrate-binding protein [Methanothrix soehngenii]|jgi:molybdate transport system substrate-binding protein|uniref:molybdate ABC transporter substrate-binding protein n=1 Tax=Methanothrix soehngenii TaxID=2223 RepID=UPI0023F4CD5E|nr:molybdate ABC transporter substrate-binding protein [Methanothrix soehngenii]MDD3974746.1 molybdate ABC transporter substrate-binding protein [Methanothrix soehngenii]MDD4487807.1 molybdate ABC transporter substrate-binding protein [Methanothrix soehngenii]MDD5735924.1 molybdate ABC transporter substrate-binding protein [Methanothrix soehngenii]